MRITSICTFICVSVLFCGQQLKAADPVPSQGSQSVVAGMPTGASPVPGSNPPLNYSLTVYYTDPTGKNTSTNITVPGIPVTAGLPNPTVAQVNAASLAKQMAIIKAINAANIPIKPVTIGGTTYNTLTAAANAKTEPGGMYPTGKTTPQNIVNRFGVVVAVVQVPVLAPADFSTYTVNGVTQKVDQSGDCGGEAWRRGLPDCGEYSHGREREWQRGLFARNHSEHGQHWDGDGYLWRTGGYDRAFDWYGCFGESFGGWVWVY